MQLVKTISEITFGVFFVILYKWNPFFNQTFMKHEEFLFTNTFSYVHNFIIFFIFDFDFDYYYYYYFYYINTNNLILVSQLI